MHKRGLVHRNGNVLRESVGTGVFHPLQRPITKTLNSVKKHSKRLHLSSSKTFFFMLKDNVWFGLFSSLEISFIRMETETSSVHVFGWYKKRRTKSLTFFCFLVQSRSKETESK